MPPIEGGFSSEWNMQGLTPTSAVTAVERNRKRNYTVKQRKFLKLFAKEGFKNAKMCAEKAGYNTSGIWQVLMSLREDIEEIARCTLLGAAPVAAETMVNILEGGSSLGNREKIAAAKEVLDRVGIVKPETVNHNHQVSGGLFILPMKQELPASEDLECEYEYEDNLPMEDEEYDGEGEEASAEQEEELQTTSWIHSG